MKKVLSICLCLVLTFFFSSNFGLFELIADAKNDTAKQFIGYGYNVTAGKAICDPDALNLNSPILDIDNAKLQNSIKVFNSSKIVYSNETSTSVSEISETYGQRLSGGLSIGASVNGLFGPVFEGNVNIGAKFDTSKRESWTKTYSEEYSYYTIQAANKPVILQLDQNEIKNYLSDKFINDISGIKTERDANKLLKKYGTHLLTGYTLGGLFELTNYYATDSSSYIREQTVGFASQVNAAISCMNGAASGEAGLDFSFSNNYGYKDNNKHAVNNYKCTTYGGKVFPGLTIDQAFSWYETLTEAGYMYKIWTDSINDSVDLVIVDIPQSSEMIPLWNLIPEDTKDAKSVRKNLISAYMKLAETSYKNHTSQYSDICPVFTPEDVENDIYSFAENGYQYFAREEGTSNYLSTYIKKADNKVENLIKPGSIIAMDYDEGSLRGAKVNWTFGNNDEYFNWIDRSTGIFEVKDNITHNIKNLNLSAYANDQLVFEKQFTIKQNDFAGGNGSKENPFLINKPEHFKNIGKAQYCNKNYEYKLLCDLDFSNDPNFKPIGTQGTPFGGVFDGNFHRIYGYHLSKAEIDNNATVKALALFISNQGTIKNLTIGHPDVLTEVQPTDYFNGSYVLKQFDYINYLSGLCARNLTGGVIENCKAENVQVKTFNADIDFDSIDGKNRRHIDGGVICGSNNGLIKSCASIDSLIGVFYNNKNIANSKSIYIAANLGGVVGKSNSDASDVSIDMCSNISTTVYYVYTCSTNQEAEGNKYLYGGGVIGYLEKGIASDCFTANIIAPDYKTLSIGDGARVFMEAHFKGKTFELYTGGLVGKISNQSTLQYSAVKNVKTLRCYTDTAFSTGAKAEYGSVAGCNEGSITKCYSENNYLTGSSQTEADVIKTVGGVDVAEVTRVNNLTWDTVASVFDTDKWESLNESPLLMPIIDTIECTFIDDLVKKQFLVGEAFKVGQLQIKALHKKGDIEYVNEYSVDWTNFNSAKPGIYKIFVYSNNLTYSYDVEVFAVKDVKLELTVKDQKTYYEGDMFDINDLIINVYKQNGIVNTVTEGLTYIHQQNASSELKTVKGLNTIIIQYGDITIKYYYEGLEKEVKSIEVKLEGKGVITEHDAELDKDIQKLNGYFVGDNRINTEPISIKLNYNDEGTDSSQYIKMSELEDCNLIIPELQYGDNEIILNYKDFKTDKFIVKATYDDITTNKEAFKAAVGKLQTASTLFERYNVIMEAKQAYAKLQDYSDSETIELKQKLDAAIAEYDTLITAVNDDFEATIEVSGTINYSILYYSGFGLFNIILILLKSLL